MRFLPILFLGVLAASPGAGAQERALVASEVSVTGQEATLRLEFADGAPLAIVLRGGRLLIDGTEVGRFSPSGALEGSWRALLGEVIALDEPEIPRILLAWTPPPGLAAESTAAAEALRARLAQALGSGSGVAASSLPEGAVRIYVGETVTIPMGESVPGSLLLVESTLNLDGRVEGDVVLIGGLLDLGQDARVEGNVRYSGTQIDGNRLAVVGRIDEVAGLTAPAGVGADPAQTPAAVPNAPSPPSAPPAPSVADQIREEVAAGVREATSGNSRGPRGNSALGQLASGFGGLLQTAVTFAILLGAGLASLYFFPRRFEIVARTARTATLRSALVGLAGIVLALPLWIVGIVLLAVSIIGIPVILLWLPALPLAIAGAMVIGYLAVARNIGQWFAVGEGRGFAGFNAGSPAANIGVGLVILLGGYALANVFEMGGSWFGIFEVVLMVGASLLGALALCTGFGAVILSKGGSHRGFAGVPWGFDEDEFPSGGEGQDV